MISILLLNDLINIVLVVKFLNYLYVSWVNISDQRNLGMSMKVERSTLEQVRARFDKNKRKREEEEKNKVSISLSQLSLFFYNYLFATKTFFAIRNSLMND